MSISPLTHDSIKFASALLLSSRMVARLLFGPAGKASCNSCSAGYSVSACVLMCMCACMRMRACMRVCTYIPDTYVRAHGYVYVHVHVHVYAHV